MKNGTGEHVTVQQAMSELNRSKERFRKALQKRNGRDDLEEALAAVLRVHGCGCDSCSRAIRLLSEHVEASHE